jgi:hypothetical protein
MKTTTSAQTPLNTIALPPQEQSRQKTDPSHTPTSVPPGTVGAQRQRAPAAPAGHALGLSKAHISPRKAHEWTARVWDGGALVELKGPGVTGNAPRGGGKRGKVGPFSPASRQRLMRKLAQIRTAVLPHFIGLTYPDEFTPQPQQWKRDLDTFFKRVRRQFPDAAAVWHLEQEPRKSGTHLGELAPHFHILLWGVPPAWEDESNRQLHWRFQLQSLDITNGKQLLRREVIRNGQWQHTEGFGLPGAGRVEKHSRKRVFQRRGQAVERETIEWWEFDGRPHLEEKLQRLAAQGVGPGRLELREWLSLVWYEIVGSQNTAHLRAGTSVEAVRSSRGVMSYASKYIAKLAETAPPVGRWWGVFRASALPRANPVEVALDPAQAVRLRRAARGYVNKQRRKKGFKWQPRWSCAWFCEASGWLRLVRALWEPPDPFEVAAIAHQLDPLRRRRVSDEPTFRGCTEAGAAKIMSASKAAWTQWKQSVSLGGFWHTP